MTEPLPVEGVTLYHYTCDHGAEGIRRDGLIRTSPVAGATSQYAAWLTDLDAPVRKGLGLTSTILDCDRTAHRFVVPEPRVVFRWVDARQWFPRFWAEALESADGAMPMHWFVTGIPQKVEAAS